jgi:hypothetical protein
MKRLMAFLAIFLVLLLGLTAPVQAASSSSGSNVNYVRAAVGVAAPAVTGPKYALCIGELYSGTAWSLSYCDRDAQLMDTVLAGCGVSVKLDIDGTYGQVVSEIQDLANEATNGGEIIFYYSGHGQKGKYAGSLPNNENMNEAILLPNGNGGLTYLWDVQLAQYFSSVPSSCRCIFIFDSCHSGGMGNLAGPNRIVVGACREQSMCDEAAKYDCHGQFTYLFAEQAIQKDLASSIFNYGYKPNVSVEEAYDYVRMYEQSQVATIFDQIPLDAIF